jgi:hypothetical protein
MKHLKKFNESIQNLSNEIDYTEVINFVKNRDVIDVNEKETEKIASIVKAIRGSHLSMGNQITDKFGTSDILIRVNNPSYGDRTGFNYKDKKEIILEFKKRSSQYYQSDFSTQDSKNKNNVFYYKTTIIKFKDDHYLIVFKVACNYKKHDTKYFITDQFSSLETWLREFKAWHDTDNVEFTH